MKTREAGRLVFLLAVAALAAACDPPSLADPPGAGAAAAPEADGPLILAAASEAGGPFVTIVPDGPRPGPTFVYPGTGHPLANESEPDFTCEDIGDCGDKCAGRRVSVCCCRKLDDGGDDKFQCWEGECSGGGGGGGEEVGGDDGWWDDIWEIISCGGDRGRLAAEYGIWGKLLCYAFWLHGDKWIVPDGDIEYGRVHGEWGLMLWQMKELVDTVEQHFGIPNAQVTSGYRCPIGNSGTPDAKPKSQHVWGSAYDFKVPGWANDRKQEIVDWVIRLGGGKWAEHYPDNPSKPHIHMQLFPKNPFFDQETDQ